MNISNQLTILRVIITFIFMFFLFGHGLIFKVLALVVFSLACLTDYLDGFFARKLKQISNFGIIMDPIADKILVLGAFISFVEMEIIPAWMVVIVILRESLITGLRIFSLGKGKVLKAERAGKHKTMSQMVTIVVILLYLIFKESGLKLKIWSEPLESKFSIFILALMGLTVILTTISGLSYLWQNRNLISKE
ncbi:MAG: CDP-diacylglycerol--glycerol-3-phosphate 3-phosphatidyltransferase [Candidatus Omnitrophota bacterium]